MRSEIISLYEHSQIMLKEVQSKTSVPHKAKCPTSDFEREKKKKQDAN